MPSKAGPSRPAFSWLAIIEPDRTAAVRVISAGTRQPAGTSLIADALVWTNICVRDPDASPEPCWPNSPRPRRRRVIRLLAAMLAFTAVTLSPALAQEGEWRHGLSLMGEPRYPIGFAHLKYVNPNAPKGGLVRFGEQGTFDNLNLFVEGVKGELEGGIALVYDTL